MATPPNPLAGGGSPAEGLLGMITGAMNNQASNPGQDVSQQSAALQGADPSISLRTLEQINQVLVVLFAKHALQAPEFANEISNTIKALSKAVKKGEDASKITKTVEAAQDKGPIAFGPVMQGTPGADQMSQT